MLEGSDIIRTAEEHIKAAEELIERADELNAAAFDRGKASDIYDSMLYRIGEMKDARIDLMIEMFKEDNTEQDTNLTPHLEGLDHKMKLNIARLIESCMMLSGRLGDRRDERPEMVSLEEVDGLCKKGMYCLVDGIQRTSKDGYNSYQISEKLRCDALPYLFERYISCVTAMSHAMKDPSLDEGSALLMVSSCRKEAKELESYISFASAICLQLLEHERKKYIFKARASSDGKLTISKKERNNTSKDKDLEIWLFGKEKEDTYIVALSDGDIEKRVKRTERQLLGAKKTKKTDSGTRSTLAAMADLVSEITQTEDSTKVSISGSAAKVKKEQKQRFGDITLKTGETFDVGRGDLDIDLGESSSSMSVSLKGISAEATMAIQTLDRLYHMLTVQGSALDLSASMRIKEAAGKIPVPAASAGVSLLSAGLKAGPEGMTIASAGAARNADKISVSLEDTMVKIGDKIFAKIKNGTDIALESGDLISRSSGSSASVKAGNNTAWVTLTVKDGKLTATPITQDDTGLKTIVDIAKDISAVAKLVKNGPGEKTEGEFSDRTQERLAAIKKYADIR